MNRPVTTCVVLLAALLGLAGCASDNADTSAQEPPPAAVENEPAGDTSDAEEAAPAPAEMVLPDGARAGSADFPFPVPADWTELYPFTEEKVGKDRGMSAIFGHHTDAASAAEHYRQLLTDAGYTIHDNPLGEQVHDAAFIVKGPVNGVAYSGTLDFDTDAEGTPRVGITLTEE